MSSPTENPKLKSNFISIYTRRIPESVDDLNNSLAVVCWVKAEIVCDDISASPGHENNAFCKIFYRKLKAQECVSKNEVCWFLDKQLCDKPVSWWMINTVNRWWWSYQKENLLKLQLHIDAVKTNCWNIIAARFTITNSSADRKRSTEVLQNRHQTNKPSVMTLFHLVHGR